MVFGVCGSSKKSGWTHKKHKTNLLKVFYSNSYVLKCNKQILKVLGGGMILNEFFLNESS